jgi:Protein of unknown function (DUF3224)
VNKLSALWAIALFAVSSLQTSTPTPNSTERKAAVTAHAKGSFEVKMTPLELHDKSSGGALGRMSSDKQFHGDLEATGKGEMLSAGDPSKGSAGYVAIEQVTGALQGRSGSFALQHSGTMDHGAFQLSITIVPGSGTGQLAGISGKMAINIVDGKHFYELEYSLPDSH